jgi:hypothetical protein
VPTATATSAAPGAASTVIIGYGGLSYAAQPVAGGAAYEIHSPVPADGFMPDPRETGSLSFRRFVHATEVDVLRGVPPVGLDRPLCVPLSASMSWADAHRLSQSATRASSSTTLRAMRDSVVVRRGTRMVKILSGRQLAGVLRGWLPQGFCHREFDVAHLRTPADLAVLRTDSATATDRAEAVFALRWRAVAAEDYTVPYAPEYAGLVAMSPHLRVGPPVLGTGFAPTNRHIVPEFVTADLADLPLPSHAELIAFTADGTEVLLYGYLAEQRAWSRLAGPQWRRLLDGVEKIAPDQEYFPIPPTPTMLLGTFRGQRYEAVADPREDEFLVLAKVRALRHRVSAPQRRTPMVTWRGTRCTVIRESDDWLRLRLTVPNPEALERTGAACVERGVYETWAPIREITDRYDATTPYDD